jgi:hypothetical protein
MTPEESPVKLGCFAFVVLESIVALDEALDKVLEERCLKVRQPMKLCWLMLLSDR